MKIVAAIFCVILGIMLFVQIFKKHKAIDTESIAIVKDVQYLGRDVGQKAYAIKYDIKSSEPFELIVSPRKKAQKVGKQKSIFYENGNPKQNYYFKTIGNFDSRFVMPFLFVVVGVVTIVIVAIAK